MIKGILVKMKIIVTGSEGLIGSKVLKYLKKNHKVVGLDLTRGVDLSDEKFIEKLFEKKEYRADVLINLFAKNHHIDKSAQSSNKIFDISLNSFSEYLHINLTTLFSVCRNFAKYNKKSSIINFSSTYGINPPPTDLYGKDEKHIGYSVSKSGVIMLTKHLATHLGPNIRVNCISPGGILNKQKKDFKLKYEKKTPLGRMMLVQDLYGVIDLLISNKSKYINGSNIVIDGGWSVKK